MIQRQSEAVQFTKPSQAEFSQQAPGYVGPDVRAEMTLDARTGINDVMLQSILKDVGGLMDTGLETSREEAFLKGSALAAQGEAEAAINSNPMTADWERAGYRNTMGKIAMADADATLVKDMQKLRESTPEQFQQYLDERRNKLLPTMNGMSREARAAMLGQMLIADRAAVATHATEHMAWQLDTKVKAIQSEWTPIKASLDASLSTGSDMLYAPEVARVMGFLGGTVWDDPTLPDDIKQDISMQAINDALNTGNVKVYTELRDRGLLSRLSMKNQEKLSEQHRQAMERTDGARLLDLSREESFMLESMKRKDFKGTIDDVYAMQAKILRADPNAGARAQNILDNFLEMGRQTSPNKTLVATNQAAGDFSANFALGVTDSEATATMHKSFVDAGMPLDQQLAKITDVAVKGSEASAKLLGQLMTNVVTGLDLTEKELSPANATTITNAIKTVQALEARGTPASTRQFYAGMDEKAALRLKRLVASGQTKGALAEISKAEEAEANMQPITKAILKAANDKAYTEYRENIAPTGTFSALISNLPFIGKTQVQASLSPRTSWWTAMTDNSAITNAYTVEATRTLDEEYERYRTLYPTALPEQAVEAAQEGAVKRLVKTPDGPFFVPSGTTPSQFFSVNGKPSTASPEQLGAALSGITPRLNPDGRFIYTVQGKNVIATEYNKDGKETVARTVLTPEMVQQYIQGIQDKQKKRFDESDGRGFAVPVGDTVMLLNGANTASMSNDVMAQVRKNLIKHEGFTVGIKPDVGGQKKADGTPVMTTGIGISDTNTYFPKKGLGPNGEITPEQHLEAFKMATNEAASNAIKLTNALNLKGKGWQVLTTELIYQSGIGTVTKNPTYASLFAPVDARVPYNVVVQEKLKLLEKVPAYTMSGASRQKHYRALLTQAITNETFGG